MTSVLIIQNYHTPYRYALFERINALGVEVVLAYAHSPSSDGRMWKSQGDGRIAELQLSHIRLGRFVFYWIPLSYFLSSRIQSIVFLDDNPTNICTILWLTVAAIARKYRFCWVEHISDTFKPRSKLVFQRICSTLIVALSNRALVFSDMSRDYVESLGPRTRICRVNQAAAPAPLRPLREPSSVCRSFGFLGADSPRKNLQALIDAFMQIADPEARLHIAGPLKTGPFERDSRIIFHGFVDGAEKEQFFASIDVLVLPSLAEPWGLVVNEAIERSCLCAVSECCGSKELVQLISTDLIFKPTVAGIYSAIEQCLRYDSQQIAAYLDRARAIADRYSIDAAARSLMDGLQVKGKR